MYSFTFNGTNCKNGEKSTKTYRLNDPFISIKKNGSFVREINIECVDIDFPDYTAYVSINTYDFTIEVWYEPRHAYYSVSVDTISKISYELKKINDLRLNH